MNGDDTRRQAGHLISEQRWLALGTVDQSGIPSVSYVPFATVDGAFGIVVSRLAAHSANLLARRPASLLLVDDGAEEPDAYARTRLTVGVTAQTNTPGSARANAIWSALESRQGATVRTLRTLPDFQAISLDPVSGRLVLGFASAHDLGADAIGELLRTR